MAQCLVDQLSNSLLGTSAPWWRWLYPLHSICGMCTFYIRNRENLHDQPSSAYLLGLVPWKPRALETMATELQVKPGVSRRDEH